uniref:Uncharacterized protein n=1 Tax=Arundo donax TaxID=35708 RepID=A0A0A9A343_ARUDO
MASCLSVCTSTGKKEKDIHEQFIFKKNLNMALFHQCCLVICSE